MKKLFLSILPLLFLLDLRAQVIFEHDYDSAATYNVGAGKISQLLKVEFELSGERYVRINRWNNSISIYDLNHSLVKVIDGSTFPLDLTTNKLGGVLYLSENLFDMDAGIEFFYFVSQANGLPYTAIYNDDASLLFSDTGAAWIYPGIPSQQLPIYNTSNGTKMILSYRNGHAKVFGLAGTLTTAIQTANQNLIQAQGLISNPAPNPVINTTKIEYTLPKNTNQGEIVFYDLQSTELKRFKVDNTFDHLLLSTADMPAGTYYYQLQTAGNTATNGKKMVVIK